jgi:hypothetical protein
MAIRALEIKRKFLDVGACESVVAALKHHGPTMVSIAEQGCRVICCLAYDDTIQARLVIDGACEVIVAILKALGQAHASVASQVR